VIARGVVLLVGRVLLLVHDDEPEIPERQEHGGARAHHEVQLPRGGRAPHVRALSGTERAVVERHATESRLPEGIEGLRESAISGTRIRVCPEPRSASAAAWR